MRKLVLLSVLTLFAAATVASAAEPQYVGALKCKACHMKEYTAWSAQPHAKAFDLLKPEEQKKPECVACHVTGAGKPGGGTKDLQGVQCEACHGPGSAYKAIDVMNKPAFQANHDGAHMKAVAAGLVIPTEESCKSCHNPKSPHFKSFDFVAAKEKIKHWPEPGK